MLFIVWMSDTIRCSLFVHHSVIEKALRSTFGDSTSSKGPRIINFFVFPNINFVLMAIEIELYLHWRMRMSIHQFDSGFSKANQCQFIQFWVSECACASNFLRINRIFKRMFLRINLFHDKRKNGTKLVLSNKVFSTISSVSVGISASN